MRTENYILGQYFRHRRVSGSSQRTHKDVLQSIGIKQGLLSKLENGQSNWTPERMQQAADFLGFKSALSFHREALRWWKKRQGAD